MPIETNTTQLPPFPREDQTDIELPAPSEEGHETVSSPATGQL